MKSRRLKKPVLYGIYALGVIGVVATFSLAYNSVSKSQLQDEEDQYVSSTIFDKTEPVVADKTILKRPYSDAEVHLVKGFYDYKADEESQKNAIIYHENTYLQSSGASYGGKENFDVVAVLDGTVLEVKKDDLLGNVVQIRHENETISTYQSLSEVSVQKGSAVKQGDVIGKSGTNNVETDLGSHLHFELILNGVTVNPEEYFDKTLPSTDNQTKTPSDQKQTE